MTRDDIIRMAEKCGIPEFENNESQADNIVRFAALVAAAERERIIAANAPEIEAVNAHIKAQEDAVASNQESLSHQEPVIDKSAAIRIATALGWEPKRT